MSDCVTIELSGGPGDGCTAEVPAWAVTVAHGDSDPDASLYRWRGLVRDDGRRVFEHMPGAVDPLSPQELAELGDDEEGGNG